MKEKEAARIGLRCSVKLKKRISDLAWKKRTTISSIVVALLEQHFPEKITARSTK